METRKSLAETKRELIEVGKEMSLEGQALLDFVKESLAEMKKQEERDERMKQLQIQVDTIENEAIEKKLSEKRMMLESEERKNKEQVELEKEKIRIQSQERIRLAELNTIPFSMLPIKGANRRRKKVVNAERDSKKITKSLVKHASKASLLCSYSIFSARNEPTWSSPPYLIAR